MFRGVDMYTSVRRLSDMHILHAMSSQPYNEHHCTFSFRMCFEMCMKHSLSRAERLFFQLVLLTAAALQGCKLSQHPVRLAA